MKWAPFFLLFSPLFAEIHVDLRDPVYQNGVIFTSKGGVIQTKDLRIQAENIQYFHRLENGKMVQRIEADTDLLVQYKDKVFVGSEIEFDLSSMNGAIYDGKTFASIWYVGGDKVDLFANGNYEVQNAFITTCENKSSSWDFHAKNVHVERAEYFQAKRVRLRFLKIPVLWLPSFKINLKKFDGPIFRYYVNWNKGPKLGFRYQLYSWHDLAFYGRLEYRWSKGWGGALETEYFPEHKKTTFVTRNYLGTDRLFNAENVERRYRIQGAFHSKSDDDKTNTTILWDKYSDVRMPGDFKSEDFDVNTALKTLFYVHHLEQNTISSLKVMPRANPFQSLKQELPTAYVATRPMELKNTGIQSVNYVKASYLNFQYSDRLVSSLRSFHSPRVEFYEELYRPFPFKALTITPFLLGRAILYGTSPTHKEKLLGLIGYGARCSLFGKKNFQKYRHIVEPYLEYKALSRPTVNPDEHYIFSIQDGFQKIQQIEFGIRNLFFQRERLYKEPTFNASLYANAFFSDPVIAQVVPKAYLSLRWQYPSIHIYFDNCYNFRNQVIDYSNTRLNWTVNENIAMSLEGRYRSKYDWRKSDHQNFILDVTRKQSSLLLSPLSDQRVTILSNVFIRLNPFWELRFESHHGFDRLYKNQIRGGSFNEFKIHLYTWVSSSWKVHFTYGYTLNNHADISFGFQLVKKTF